MEQQPNTEVQQGAVPLDCRVSDLSSAIAHARDVAEREGCTACGAEHRQLAGWLAELESARKLLPLYRQLVGRISTADDARVALSDMRVWWGSENKLRIAADLPEHEGRAFIGR